MKTCLFNSCSDHSVAYCKHHHCGMTVKQMKCKNCLGKQCWYFEKNEEHNYWKKKAEIKELRKKRKNEIDMYVMSIKGE